MKNPENIQTCTSPKKLVIAVAVLLRRGGVNRMSVVKVDFYFVRSFFTKVNCAPKEINEEIDGSQAFRDTILGGIGFDFFDCFDYSVRVFPRI